MKYNLLIGMKEAWAFEATPLVLRVRRIRKSYGFSPKSRGKVYANDLQESQRKCKGKKIVLGEQQRVRN